MGASDDGEGRGAGRPTRTYTERRAERWQERARFVFVCRAHDVRAYVPRIGRERVEVKRLRSLVFNAPLQPLPAAAQVPQARRSAAPQICKP
jgi:hypothetical protein